MKKLRAVHLALPVSRWMVRRVVEQGQWVSEKRQTEMAVTHVQPFATKRVCIWDRLSSSKILPSQR